MGLEIRWFFRGSTPPSVESWFQSRMSFQFRVLAEKCQDVYLRNRDDGLGLKLRGGSFEIKWRQRYEEFVGAGGRVKGQLEDWTKWSWTAPAGAVASQIEDSIRYDAHSPWIEVAKERLRLKYVFDENRFTLAGLDDWVDRGCAIELTRLRVHDQSWWTLALDIFGSGGEVTMILYHRAETLFTDYPGPELTLVQSYGYPQWLTSVR